MKISFYFFCLLFFTVLVLLTGCANLDKMNDFANSAEKGIAGFETLPVTFKSTCIADCKEEDVKAGRLNDLKCNCGLESQADSVSFVFYKTISGYLEGLQKLSANQTTTYNVDSLNTQLTDLKISPATSGAYSKLAGILAKAITDSYRRNKLKNYIKQANPYLQELLHYLGKNIGTSLVTKLGANKIKLEADYFDLLKDSKNSNFEKRIIIEAFVVRNIAIENQLAELKAYANLLKIIADGHQQLTDNLDKLNKDGLKTMLSQ